MHDQGVKKRGVVRSEDYVEEKEEAEEEEEEEEKEEEDSTEPWEDQIVGSRVIVGLWTTH